MTSRLNAVGFLALAVMGCAAGTAGGAGSATVSKPEFEKVQIVLLRRPANPPTFTEAELEVLQAKHLAYLGRMGEEGKMLVAGPFGDQSDPALRGLCVYRVESTAEARALAETDPMVKAGRLEVAVMDWYFEKGYLAFPKAPAQP